MNGRFEGVGVTARELEPGTAVMVPVGKVNAQINGGPCVIAWAVVREPAVRDRADVWWLDVYMSPGVALPQMYQADEILGVPALGLSMDGAAPSEA